MNPLISRLKIYGELSAEAEEELHKRITCLQKKKDDFLLRQGQVLSGLFLLEKGLVRVYFMRNGKEMNAWFGMENMLPGSILPLYTNKPSFENIQFLEDSIVYPFR